jgi:xylose isomerase
LTANDPAVRAYALQKTMRAMDIGAELGAGIFVLWGGREGTETDACRRPMTASQTLREGRELSCANNSLDRGYGHRFALEAKPNEPRGDIYMATTGATSDSSPRLTIPRWSASTQSRARTDGRLERPACRRAGVGRQASCFTSISTIRCPGRYDQDFRLGAANLKSTFWLVKFLEDVGYDGPMSLRRARLQTRTMTASGRFARGCMRTYLS